MTIGLLAQAFVTRASLSRVAALQVMRGQVLSALYDTPVQVLRSGGRYIVVGGPEHDAATPHCAGSAPRELDAEGMR